MKSNTKGKKSPVSTGKYSTPGKDTPSKIWVERANFRSENRDWGFPENEYCHSFRKKLEDFL